MGLREQSKVEFRLIKMFLGLILHGIDLLLSGNAHHARWADEKRRFFKELDKYEEEYL